MSRTARAVPLGIDVEHHCALAPYPGDPHTTPIRFTNAVTDVGAPGGRRGTRLTGTRCDGTPIDVIVDPTTLEQLT